MHHSCGGHSQQVQQTLDEMDFERSIHNACVQGDYKKVLKWLDKVDVDELDRYGYTPLSYACLHGRLNIVSLLIQRGANINHCTPTGKSCLWRAIKGGNEQVARFLLFSGADPTIKDYSGNYPWSVDAKLESIWRNCQNTSGINKEVN